MRISQLAVTVAIVGACGKTPEPAPVTPARAASSTHCAEVARRYVQYPEQLAEQEPQRLSGAFPKIAPARRDTAFTVSFVVDTLGKPVISTFAVSKHVGSRFTTELRKSVIGWRYSPASAEGCRIRRKVTHTINTGAPRRRRAENSGDGNATRTTQHAALFRSTQHAAVFRTTDHARTTHHAPVL